MPTVMALARLRICAGSPELLRLANMTSTEISCVGSIILSCRHMGYVITKLYVLEDFDN